MRASLISLLLVVGCKERNPHYCEGEPMNLCPETDSGPTKCMDNDDCAGVDNAHVCKMPDGVCVQCTPDDKTACTGTAPLCNATTNRCEACKEHADCMSTSGVCMPDGSCAAADDVAYVAPGASGNCGRQTPCGTLTAAVMTSKPVIKLAAGMFTMDANTVSISRAVSIVGEGQDAPTISELRRAASGAQIIASGASANVMLYRMRVAGGIGANALELTNGATLKLDRVTVTGADQFGIQSSGGNLTVTRSTISNNDDGALNLNSSTRFTILHNFIRQNGRTDGPGSAIEIAGSMGTDLFEFNTVAGNSTSDSLVTAIDCSGAGLVRNNIIYANTDGVGNAEHVTGNCMITSNILGPGGTPRAGNTDVDPLFGNQQPHIYKLQATSPARGMAATMPPAAYAFDFDGEPRPNPAGQPADLGADEIP